MTELSGDFALFAPKPKVLVRLQRRDGKRLEGKLSSLAREFIGPIELHADRDIPFVTMRRGDPADKHRHVPPDLYCPMVRAISPTQLRLMGFEKGAEGASYVQEWVIEFAHQAAPERTPSGLGQMFGGIT